jgi:pyridoxamine 5'-phosphate oxidase
MAEEDIGNKMPDFGLQTIGRESVIAFRPSLCFPRLPLREPISKTIPLRGLFRLQNQSIKMPDSIDIAAMRQNYKRRAFSDADADADPFAQFENWFREAVAADLHEPNAMTLATATRDGRPSARIVLLKGLDGRGFVFFTNYESRKGRQLADNPQAALLFFWPDLERQVRIEGSIEKIPEAASRAYFQSRPKGSQIGAWASPQSKVLEGRALLEKAVEALTAQYENAETLPLPPFWGGYRLLPDLFEFWQGRESRLHDRIQYTPDGANWKKERLAP